MGCGGSKEDVAAGNTATRRLLQKDSSAVTSKSSSTDAATSTSAASDEAKSIAGVPVEGAPSVSLEEAEVIAAGKDQTSSSEEYFTSWRDVEGLEAGRERAAGYHSQNEDSGTQVAAEGHAVEQAEGVGGVAAGSAVLEEEEEEEAEEVMSRRDDEGESIGQHSVDFKDTISVIEEEAGGDVTISENKNCKSEAPAEIVKEL